ncbi:unnamed protein product, partial [Amoebophrya sp. A120]
QEKDPSSTSSSPLSSLSSMADFLLSTLETRNRATSTDDGTTGDNTTTTEGEEQIGTTPTDEETKASAFQPGAETTTPEPPPTTLGPKSTKTFNVAVTQPDRFYSLKVPTGPKKHHKDFIIPMPKEVTEIRFFNVTANNFSNNTLRITPGQFKHAIDIDTSYLDMDDVIKKLFTKIYAKTMDAGVFNLTKKVEATMETVFSPESFDFVTNLTDVFGYRIKVQVAGILNKVDKQPLKFKILDKSSFYGTQSHKFKITPVNQKQDFNVTTHIWSGKKSFDTNVTTNIFNGNKSFDVNVTPYYDDTFTGTKEMDFNVNGSHKYGFGVYPDGGGPRPDDDSYFGFGF